MRTPLIASFLLAVFFLSCSKVPISGRRQMRLLPESQLMAMSLTEYNSFLSSNKKAPNSDPNTQMVKEVGEKISKSVATYLAKHGQSARIKNFRWEFNLVDDPTVNAWCMPGGKVVFYTGILPITQDVNGLAVVMGHEIAHAVARHGNERMSQGLLVMAGGIGLQVALSEKPELTRGLLLQSFGVGSQLGVLKFSRTHESEADMMGLVFMAMSGYDPSAAVGFWQRMAEKSGGQAPPEFMSTHPSDERRIADIKAFLPKAMKYYKKK